MRKFPEQLDGEIQAVLDYPKAGKPEDVERWVDNWLRENRGKNWAQPRFAKEYVKAIRDRLARRSHASMSSGSQFVPFDTWNDVLDAARRGDQLWYQAPLNIRPASVRVVKVFKNGSVRIDPMSRDADNFTADKGHLSRFRQRR